MLSGHEPILLVEDRIVWKHTDRFHQYLMKRFILLIRQREDLRKGSLIGNRHIAEFGKDTIPFHFIDRKHLFEWSSISHGWAISGEQILFLRTVSDRSGYSWWPVS